MHRFQQYTDVGELLVSSDDSASSGEEVLITFNRVNELIAKWNNNPSKQQYLADLRQM